MSGTVTVYAAEWLISPGSPPLEGGGVAVADGVVIAAGDPHQLSRTYSAAIKEYPGCAILPGFVNAHTHLELTHFPAWRLRTNVDYHPRRFVDWIIQLVKIKRGIRPEEIPASVAEGIRLCIESGTTAVGEILSSASLAGIYRASPLTGRLYFEVLGQDPVRFSTMLDTALRAAAEPVDRMKSGISPHSPYTIAESFLPRIGSVAASGGLPLAIHIAESAAETAFIFDGTGPLAEELYPFLDWKQYLSPPRRCSSTELLDRAGLLTPNTLAVHCVHLTLADAEILKQRGTRVVICPRSNERLDVGRAPLQLLKKLHVPLALGTDSLASNDTLSLWDEMRFALDTFPGELTPEELIRMATMGGAEAIGLSATHGTLEPGKRADFQVVALGDGGSHELLERVLHHTSLEDIYLGGERYQALAKKSLFRRRQQDQPPNL